MSRLRTVLLSILLLLPTLSPVLAQRGTKWNILLVSIDTLRADHLPIYGYDKVKTPNLDALAAEATVFEHAVAPVPLTLPSHASILTGAYPLYHGIRDNAGFILGPDQLTLAEILKEAGYSTGAFVGSFVLDSRFGLDQGFDRYFADFELTGMDTIAPGLIQRPAGEVEAEASKWIDAQRSGGKPFFCWMHFYDPHAPYEPPDPFSTTYRQSLYDGEIAYVDHVLGKLFSQLKQWQLWDNTIVIVTGDHGESLGEHGEETHGFFVYEATQHVPLVWKSPNPRLTAKRVPGTVQLVDLAPSILQEIGIRAPNVMQGTGFLRAMMGRSQPASEAYAESYYSRLQFGWSELKTIYRYPYKYIEAPRPELYNLAEDPGELKNLFDENQSLANTLKEELLALMGRYSAGSGQQQSGMDAETAAALASLGYVAVATPSDASDESYLELPDPKDKIRIYSKTTDTYTMIREGKYAQAIEVFQSILSEDPDATFVYHTMGTAYAKMGQHQKAIGVFLKAAESFPQDAMLLFNLGSSYLRLRDWDKAEESFEKVLVFDPSHFRAKGNLASLWLQKQRFADALKASEEILLKHPNYEVALFNAGIGSAATGRTAQAIQYLTRASEVNPENPETWQALAQLYTDSGNSAKAAECRAKAQNLRRK